MVTHRRFHLFRIPKTQSSNLSLTIFSTFVSKYNETHEDDLVATKLIRTREITLSDDVKGYYFDFDQGYMVATSDYDIRSISNFDLSFESDLFSTDSVYFSGTAFYDSNGVEYRTSDDEILTTKLGTPATTKSSPATNQNDGKITSDDIGSYISSNYSGYTIVDEKYIPLKLLGLILENILIL